ncbi:hypothetical protein GCM10023169_35410 [Georgenia halophila]|uniref:Tripartite ATP-independent periplasmic transporters DctQ component domain-containing protein n=1 Tax=Georgenia halophila TaxID=620889 RepID=A0ABP8LMK2_9MICO
MSAPGLRKDAVPFENVVVWIAAVFGIISAVGVVVTMLAIATQVLVRWITDYSIPGLVELSQSCLVVSIFCGLGWAGIRGEHVSVRLLTDRLSHRVNHVIDVIVWTGGSIFMAWLTAAAVLRAIESTADGEAGPSVTLVWYLWPWRWVMAVGLAVLTLVALTNLVRAFLGRMPYDSASPVEHAPEEIAR